MARISAKDRENVLADVAEMYYVDRLGQAEIAKQIGVTRSMVSRMLTEAHEKKIIRIHIERRFNYNQILQQELIDRFLLKDAIIFNKNIDDNLRYLSRLGAVAAYQIQPLLLPGITLGAAWGTALDATINALERQFPRGIRVVQLGGALRGRNLEIDGHGVVQQLVNKLSAEGYYLNVPYIVDQPEIKESLMQVAGVKETMKLMKQCDLGLFGIGSIKLDYSTFYSDGYLIADEMRGLMDIGAVGNVCGLFFNLDGEPTAKDFQARTFTISRRDLLKIPTRIGIAGGAGKVDAILGSLRGEYINVLITDEHTASSVLDLAKKSINSEGKKW